MKVLLACFKGVKSISLLSVSLLSVSLPSVFVITLVLLMSVTQAQPSVDEVYPEDVVYCQWFVGDPSMASEDPEELQYCQAVLTNTNVQFSISDFELEGLGYCRTFLADASAVQSDIVEKEMCQNLIVLFQNAGGDMASVPEISLDVWEDDGGFSEDFFATMTPAQIKDFAQSCQPMLDSTTDADFKELCTNALTIANGGDINPSDNSVEVSPQTNLQLNVTDATEKHESVIAEIRGDSEDSESQEDADINQTSEAIQTNQVQQQPNPLALNSASVNPLNPLNPLAAVTAPFAGSFEGDKLSLNLGTAIGGGYAGTLVIDGQSFPVKAQAAGNVLTGTFNAGGNEFPFTATLDGSSLELVSDGNQFMLNKVAAKNPLGN